MMHIPPLGSRRRRVAIVSSSSSFISFLYLTLRDTSPITKAFSAGQGSAITSISSRGRHLYVTAVKMVQVDGTLLEVNENDDPDLMRYI